MVGRTNGHAEYSAYPMYKSCAIANPDPNI